MLHQYTFNELQNQPQILKKWLTEKKDEKKIIKIETKTKINKK